MGALMNECEHGADGAYRRPSGEDYSCAYCEIDRLRAFIEACDSRSRHGFSNVEQMRQMLKTFPGRR